jgi:hypothetical protein
MSLYYIVSHDIGIYTHRLSQTHKKREREEGEERERRERRERR